MRSYTGRTRETGTSSGQSTWLCKELSFHRHKLKSNGSLWFIVIPWMTLRTCLKNSSSRHFLEERQSSRRWKAACQSSSDFETSDEITALKITKFASTWKSIISCAAHQTQSTHSTLRIWVDQGISRFHPASPCFTMFHHVSLHEFFVISPPAGHRPSTNSPIRWLSFQRSPHLVIAPSENRTPVAKSLTKKTAFFQHFL